MTHLHMISNMKRGFGGIGRGPKFWNTPKRNSVEDLACFDYWTLLTGRKTDKHNKRAGRVPIA